VPQIGIRELKIRASEILRNVRRRKTRYVITYRGRPVDLLTPVEEPALSTAASTEENWDALNHLGQKIAAGWPAGVSSADILSGMRQ
jgi:prevent-host-death family protein